MIQLEMYIYVFEFACLSGSVRLVPLVLLVYKVRLDWFPLYCLFIRLG